jgi:Arc/MetJ-type ribon-helix-helix transcriptional regulator
MSTQISVRLSEEIVEVLDELVADGTYRSRATAVERALFHELRRALALRDLEILERTKDEPDLDDLAGLARWGSDQPVDVD